MWGPGYLHFSDPFEAYPAAVQRTAVSSALICLVLVIPACASTTPDTTTGMTIAPRATTATGNATTTTAVTPPTTATTPPTTTTSTSSTTTTTTTLVPPDGLTAAERTLTETTVIGGEISPKSVVASGYGLFVAQNMMYRHTITVYDRQYELVATIADVVEPAAFGYEEYEGEYLGSPVEAAFTSDGSYAYISNYKMYGGSLSTAAGDGCDEGPWPNSFVYRLDMQDLAIDQIIEVGAVPKFLAVTPDDRRVVVSNWCGFDVSVLDVASGTEVTRIPVGRHPRGVAITSDSSTAYVAVMGSTRIAVIDLDTFHLSYLENVGSGPRHLVLSPDDAYLYVSLNSEGRLAKIDLATGETVGRVATGSAPRSMTISDDGTALYVVNYRSATMSKVRTDDMVELEEHPTRINPIGITYDAATREVWVSNYSGTIQVFTDG